MITIRKKPMECIGLIPAAGKAERLSPIPCSKEILPIGIGEIKKDGLNYPKVAAHYLLEKFATAGAKRVYIVLSKGKWDIPAYFGSGSMANVSIGYLITELSYGVPFTVDIAFPFLTNKLVLFGFPDILFQPDDVYIKLIDRYYQSGADIVLGLFVADNPKKMDMVEFGLNQSICDIQIKPLHTNLKWTWVTAVWNYNFTQFLHEWVNGYLTNSPTHSELSDNRIKIEKHLGDVIRDAIKSKLKIDSVAFNHGKCIDIGSPEDLVAATQKQILY